MVDLREDTYGNVYADKVELYCGGMSTDLRGCSEFHFHPLREGLFPQATYVISKDRAKEKLRKFLWNWENLP